MTASPPPYEPGRSYAPPMQAGPVPPPVHESAWPKVLGIVTIVLGLLMVLGGLWGMISPFVMEAIQSLLPPAAMGPAIDILVERKAWIVGSSLLTLTLAVVQLVMGAGIMKRRAWAPRLSMLWAFVTMAFVVIASIMNYKMTKSHLEATASAGMPPMPAGFTDAMAFFGLIVGLVMGWALPVFMLIWFSRPKIKSETARWT